ncbi:MAG TPA: DUF4230 domain-containing protein [Anaerolineaceae bacterium]
MNNGEKKGINLTQGLLIFIAVIVVLGLLGVGLVIGIGEAIRQTAAQALSPITQTNQTIATRVAQYMHPTPTVLPDPVTVIHEIRSLARLETIQYTLEKVITAENNQNQLSFLFGDKLIFVGHGQVIAGVDLARMNEKDMWVQNQVLYVRLPQAEIFVATLDNSKSYVYNRDTGILTKGDTNLETTARQAAEKEILASAINDGILTQAQQNAESYMSRMLRNLGYPDVVFVHDNNATPIPSLTPQPYP